MKDESQANPLFLVRDINHGGPLLVELSTPNRFQDAKKFKIGHTVCVTDGTFHAFPDGRNGFRITDPHKLEVSKAHVNLFSMLFSDGETQILPVSVRKLRELNGWLRRRSDAGELMRCNYCNRQCENQCGACKSQYCSKV